MNRKSPSYILLFMTAICLVCGTGVAIVNYATQGLVAKTATLHLNTALCHAFGIKVTGTSAEAYQQAVDANLQPFEIGQGATRRQAYRQITPGHESLGFVFSGVGFWDRITGLVVLTPDLQRILNVQFLDQQETPGLGARIEEPWFTDQFKGLLPNWSDPQGRRIVIGAAPGPNVHNRIDAITGATQTSLALMRFLNEELDQIRATYAAAPQPLNPEPQTPNSSP